MVTLKGRRAEPFCPIWTISEIYLPIDGYYDRAKFRADRFSRSGGVRGKKPECGIGSSLALLNYLWLRFHDRKLKLSIR